MRLPPGRIRCIHCLHRWESQGIDTMKWYRGLYLGDSLKDKKETLIREIGEGQYRNNLYLITLASNGKDLLDIRRARALVRESLREGLPMIVGLAKGYREAVRVTERIIQDTLAETGDVDVRSFLQEDGMIQEKE